MSLKKFAQDNPSGGGKPCWTCGLPVPVQREIATGYAEGIAVTTITAYLKSEGHTEATDSKVRRHLKEHTVGTR